MDNDTSSAWKSWTNMTYEYEMLEFTQVWCWLCGIHVLHIVSTQIGCSAEILHVISRTLKYLLVDHLKLVTVLSLRIF